MTTNVKKDNIAKVLVIGDVKTGKTSIISQYIYKIFNQLYHATLGVDFALKRVRVEDILLNFQLWDISGNECSIGLAPSYYKNAVAAIIVFDIISKETLDNAAKWKGEIDDKVFLPNGDKIPVVLFANKWDLVEEKPNLKAVTYDEIDNFCFKNNLIGWFTTSAKTGLHVKKGMNFLITKIVKNKRKLDGPVIKNDKLNNDSLNSKISKENIERNEEKKSQNKNGEKVLVIGDATTGKTSIINRYVYKTFDENYSPTLGVDFSLKRVRVEDKLLNIQFWDIAGREKFKGLSPVYYKHSVAVIIVFDITSKETLENAAKWKSDIDGKVFLPNGDNIPVVLFANKWDVIKETPSLRAVTDDELDEFCHENNLIGWFTTSAKTGLHVKKGMNFVIFEISKNKKILDSTVGVNNELDNKNDMEINEQQKEMTQSKDNKTRNKNVSNVSSECNNKLDNFKAQTNDITNNNNENLVSDNQNKLES